jgi:hypothetical protein
MFWPIRIKKVPGIMNMYPMTVYPLGICCKPMKSIIEIEIIGSKRADNDGNKGSGKRFDIIAYAHNIPKPIKIDICKKVEKWDPVNTPKIPKFSSLSKLDPCMK